MTKRRRLLSALSLAACAVTLLLIASSFRRDAASTAITPPPSLQGVATLDAVESPEGGFRFYYRSSAGKVELPGMERPQVYLKWEFSPDGRWVFIVHGDGTCDKVSVYDLQTVRRTAAFDDLFALNGDFRWIEGNRILRMHGAGTYVVCYAVRDTRGRVLAEGNAGGVSVSPDGMYLATFPTHSICADKLAFIDLRSLACCRTGYDQPGMSAVRDVEWTCANSARITYDDERGEPRSFSVVLKDPRCP